jgi:hypothetical protein
MPKTAAMGDNFYLGGNDLSGDIAALGSIRGGPALIDVTDITQSAMERRGGERDGGMTFTSFFDPATAHPVLSALPVADVIASYFRGKAIGNPSACLTGKQVNYDGTRGTDGSFTLAADIVANGSGLEWGVQLTPGHRVDSAATAAGPGNSFDTGGSLAFGAQMYVHLFAFAGTSVTIKVQDSADNITFLDIAGTSLTTIALTSAPQAARVTIPNTTTVRRYIAVATVGTFSNADFAVTVHKNEIAGIVF